MSIVSDPPMDAAQKRALLARLMREKQAAESFVSRFAKQVAATPDAPAIEDGVQTLTYAALDAAARALAADLAAHVTPGDQVALAVPPGADFAVGLIAAAWVGATVLPLAPDGSPALRARQLAAAHPVAVVVSRGGQAIAEVPHIEVPSSPAASAAEGPPAAPPATFAILWCSDAPIPAASSAVAARLSHAPQILPLATGDRVVFAASTYSEAMTLQLLWPLCTGATVVAAPPQADDDTLCHVIAQAGITAAAVRPSTLIALADNAVQHPLRRLVVTGEPISTATAKRLVGAGVALRNSVNSATLGTHTRVEEALWRR
ncbi:MAG: AMP-binding protein [Pseudomonadota bacterium]